MSKCTLCRAWYKYNLYLFLKSVQYVGVDPLQAGNVVQLVLVLGLTIGWISTYIFRVSNKEMTYAQQLRDYEDKVMQVKLYHLIRFICFWCPINFHSLPSGHEPTKYYNFIISFKLRFKSSLWLIFFWRYHDMNDLIYIMHKDIVHSPVCELLEIE